MAKQCHIYPELYASLKSILDYVEQNEVIGTVTIDGKEFTVGDLKDMLTTCDFTQKPKDKRKLNKYNIHMSHCLKGTDEFEDVGKQDWQTCVAIYRERYGTKKKEGQKEPIEVEVA